MGKLRPNNIFSRSPHAEDGVSMMLLVEQLRSGVGPGFADIALFRYSASKHNESE
jgi:hypothetical protein